MLVISAFVDPQNLVEGFDRMLEAELVNGSSRCLGVA